MVNMKIVRMKPFSQPSEVGQIVSIYKEVFGEDPWNEGYKCPVCGNNYALSLNLNLCPNCLQLGKKIVLTEYWTTSQIITDFYREMSLPGSVCYLAKNDQGEIVGTTWAYEMMSGVETDMILEAPGLFKLLGAKRYFYLDEIAVLKHFRGKGVGKDLYSALCNQATTGRILLRTKRGSSAYRMVLKSGGRVRLNISGGRVIMTIIKTI